MKDAIAILRLELGIARKKYERWNAVIQTNPHAGEPEMQARLKAFEQWSGIAKCVEILLKYETI